MRLLLFLLISGWAQGQMRGFPAALVEASRLGRLKTFVRNADSPPVKIFLEEARAANDKGDWNGEHAGKWLAAASRAAARSGDLELKAAVLRIARTLAATQEPNGYIGTYKPGTRFYDDAAYRKARTWDIWVSSYVILGFLEAHRHFGAPDLLEAASRIGDLCLKTLEGGKSIAYMGNHAGLSATVLLEPAVELYSATRQQRFLRLAKLVLDQAEERPELRLLSQARRGADLSEIGDGKAYQLLWTYVGLVKLHKATGDAQYLEMAKRGWESVTRHHLTPGGGPWGGAGVFSECFSRPGAFSPYGFVEVCSIMSWLDLNRELLLLTGEDKYGDEIERTVYNDLPGAAFPGGEDWCYFVFPNGQRHKTYEWACCKSSGALALESIEPVVVMPWKGGVKVNLFIEGDYKAGGRTVRIRSGYPFSGRVRIESDGPVEARRPAWAMKISGTTTDFEIEMRPRIIEAAARFVQDGRQELQRLDYVAVMKGPLVYATGLIDGFKREETIRAPRAEQLVEVDGGD